MDVQEHLLNWAISATMDERLDFLYKYLKVIPANELDPVIKKVQAAKKRSRRQQVGNDKEKIQALKKKLKIAKLDEIPNIEKEIKEAEERRRAYEESKLQSRGNVPEPVTPLGALAVPSGAQAVHKQDWVQFPMNDYIKDTCFEKFFPTNYVFLDCETVMLNNGELECGSVAVVDHNQKTIYKTHVFHAANTFKINQFTTNCNGFNYDSLADPAYPKLEEVSDRVQQLIDSKLVILVGGDNGKQNSYNDLISLKLDASKISVYNLHFHFYKTTSETTTVLPMGDEIAAFIVEPISLRRLCMKYFDLDIQSGIHDAETDALYTAKIFQEILPLKLQPGLKDFIEYDKNRMCAYHERYVDFDDEPKMRTLMAKIRAARSKKAWKR